MLRDHRIGQLVQNLLDLMKRMEPSSADGENLQSIIRSRQLTQRHSQLLNAVIEFECFLSLTENMQDALIRVKHNEIAITQCENGRMEILTNERRETE
jgi:hypothetical protein